MVTSDPLKIIRRNFITTCIMTRRRVASQFGVSRFKVKVTHRGQRSTFSTILLVRTVTSDPLKIIWWNFIATCIMSRRRVASQFAVSRFKAKVTHRGQRSTFSTILVWTVTSDPIKIIRRNFIATCIMTRRRVASQFGVSHFKVKVTHRGQRSPFWIILLVIYIWRELLNLCGLVKYNMQTIILILKVPTLYTI
jgi:predicted XRE-type DNA-binding protein